MLEFGSKLATKTGERISQDGFASAIAGGLHFIGNRVQPAPAKKLGESIFPFSAPDTTIQVHAYGLGDLMIVRQFGRAVQRYYAECGDPELGDVVLACGSGTVAENPDRGDINLWWWWSFGDFDGCPEQYLNHYINETKVEPDAILCPSQRCVKETEQAGYNALYFPLGTQAFEPLGFDRSGMGYAGSKNHKRSEKRDKVLGPYRGSETFEWVSHFVYPEQLNQWYNQKMVTFGLHKEGQRQYGMVNNRVFETLASGTPFVLESHPTVNDVLGFEFPYQTSSVEETRSLVDQIRNNPEETVAEFQDYAELVRENHSYDARVSELIEFLS